MAEANRVRGQNLYVSFAGTEISADYRSFGADETADVVESTAGSQTRKTYIPSLEDGTATLEYAYAGGTANAAYIATFKVGTEGTLLWGVEGSAAGNPKGGVLAIVTGHSKPVAYADLVMRTVTFQFTGAMLFRDETDTW